MVTEDIPESEDQARPRPQPEPPFPDLSTSHGRNLIFLNMLPGYSSQFLPLILRSREINTTHHVKRQFYEIPPMQIPLKFSLKLGVCHV